MTTGPVYVLNSGKVNVETAADHGLVSGQQIVLSGMSVNPVPPTTSSGVPSTTGNPGTADANQSAMWSSIRSDLATRSNAAATLLASGDVYVSGGLNLATATARSSASRFRILASADITSGVAEDRIRYSYNWVTTAAMGSTKFKHTATGLFGTLSGKALILGGTIDGVTPTSVAVLYDEATDSYANVGTGTLTSRFGHLAIRVEDASGDDVVYVVGGETSANTATGVLKKFTSAAGGTLSATILTESDGRFRSAGVASSASRWVAAGGAKFVSLVATVRGDCLAYDELTSTQLPCGDMGVARMDHALVKIGEDIVMAIGGLGRVLSRESTDRVLAECEVLDLANGCWNRVSSMRYARQLPTVFVFDEKVYVSGGWDAAGDPVQKTEIFDIKTGKWSLAPELCTQQIAVRGTATVLEQDIVLFHGGTIDDANSLDTAYLFIPGALEYAPFHSLNKTVTIDEVPTSTTFTFQTEPGSAANLLSGSIEPLTAEASESLGPFIWDNQGVAWTATNTTTTQEIREGGQVAYLSVADASDFPDSAAWLVFNYGLVDQVGPVKYLGKVSDTSISLDSRFSFPVALSSGSKVTLLSQRTPYIPENPEESGSFYLTDSSAGRIAAQKAIEEAVAAGIDYEITTVYPGDVGLGNAGRPSSGAQKLSDKVWVWGGDSLADIDKAREE